MKKKILIATVCMGMTFFAMAQKNNERLKENPAYSEESAKKPKMVEPAKTVDAGNTDLVPQEAKSGNHSSGNSMDEMLKEKRNSILANTELTPEEKKEQLARLDNIAAKMKAEADKSTKPAQQPVKATQAQPTEKKKTPVKS